MHGTPESVVRSAASPTEGMTSRWAMRFLAAEFSMSGKEWEVNSPVERSRE